MNTTVRGEHAVVSEKMSTSDAYKFPIIGSIVLFSLYAVCLLPMHAAANRPISLSICLQCPLAG
jgi:hypothetical protein